MARAIPACTALSKSTSQRSCGGITRSSPSGWAGVERLGDRVLADLLQHPFAAAVADHHEALGQLLDLRRPRPGEFLRRRVRPEDDEGGGEGDAGLGRRRRRHVFEVERGVVVAQFPCPRRADRGIERRRRRFQRRPAFCPPDRLPVGGDRVRLRFAQWPLGGDDEDLVGGLGLGRRRGHVRRLKFVDDEAGATGAVGGDQVAPGRPFVAFDAAGAPDPHPVALRVFDLVGREIRLEGVDRAVVGIDADPELRAAVVAAAEAGLDPQRQQRQRRAVGQLADHPAGVFARGAAGGGVVHERFRSISSAWIATITGGRKSM
jgi:hypothetical protein